LKQARCANAVRALHAMFAPCLHRKSRRNSTEASGLLVVNRFYRVIQNPVLMCLLMHARAFPIFDAHSLYQAECDFWDSLNVISLSAAAAAAAYSLQ
jgi:hypothetical protein